MGDLTYKKEWCNHMYHYEQFFVYKKTAAVATKVKTILHYLKTRVRELLFTLFYERYKKYKEQSKSTIIGNSYHAAFIPLENFDNTNYININTAENDFLKNAAYDFLYMSSEHENDLKISKLSEKEYIAHGKHKAQKITFE